MSFGSHVSFKWKGKSCPDGEVSSSCLGHGDILVMDGHCQDEFFHCTDPGLEQEQINVTFRWIVLCVQEWCVAYRRVCRVHLLLLRGVLGWYILGTLGAPWSLVHIGVLALLVFPLMSAGLGLRRCAYRWTRGWRVHYLRHPGSCLVCTKLCLLLFSG